ncbi:hypothetical protein CHUAL_004291 [Chamberlinius hualienensis]
MATVLSSHIFRVNIRRNNCLNLLADVFNKAKWTSCLSQASYYRRSSHMVTGCNIQHQQMFTLNPDKLFIVNKQSYISRYVHVAGSKYSASSSSDNSRGTGNTRHVDSKVKSEEKDLDKNGELDEKTGRSKIDETRVKIKETTEKIKEKLEETIVKENIFTVPNYLCVTRIILSPVLGYLVLQNNFDFALGLFAFAGVTDLLDGYIARNFKNQQSMFGSFLDPMADKFLVFCLFLSLTYVHLIPIPLTSLIVARDVCLFGAGFYIRYLSLPPPKTLSRYFDATYATAQLSPTIISKVNTAVQLILVACTLSAPVFHLENELFFQVLWYLTATTTTLSGISYIFSKNSYQLLKKIKDTRKD